MRQRITQKCFNHEVFCFGLAFKNEGRYKDKLLFTIISGSNSALQSMKGSIDLGSQGGLSMGYGKKETTDFMFHREKALGADKRNTKPNLNLRF